MATTEEQRLQGCVDWYRADEGYGVIRGDDRNEYFVHHTNLPAGLIPRMGDRVSFLARDRRRGRGGQEAYDVRREELPKSSQPKRTRYTLSELAARNAERGGLRPEPPPPTPTPSKEDAVESTRRAAEEALRLKIARRQGVSLRQDELSPGTRVQHAQFGPGAIVLALPTQVSVRFDREPRILREVPRAEIRPVSKEAVAPTSPTSVDTAQLQERRSKDNLQKLIVQLHADVQETLTEEGLDGVTVYRFDPPLPALQQPAPMEIDPLISGLYRNVEGITAFYSHQIEARRYLVEGRHVIICTPTASGKTEAYNPTIFETLLRDARATALYLFPLVALGEDQLGRLERLNEALPESQRPVLGIYNNNVDWETKGQVLRADNRILVTTPDSLHYIFLGKPYPNWRNFYRNLRYVVLDEAHIYRGVLGANMANIVRRLLVRCRREGNPRFPQLIISSATVRHPLQLAQQLTGLPETDFALIDQSGAPIPGRHHLATRSDIHDLNELCADLMTVNTRDIRTGEQRPARIIVFQRSINAVKQSAQRLREYLGHQGQRDLSTQVEDFYSEKSSKRDVFAALRRGEIRCLFTTIALMAGIDIGSLDVAVVDGFPGKVMDVRQMFGRAGRTGEGASIFVARPADPFDRYYFERSEVLFRGETEDVVANPENPFLLTAHLKCAAQVENGQYNNREGPLPVEWLHLFGQMGSDVVSALGREGEMVLRGDALSLRGLDPHDLPPLNNLRSMDTNEFVLQTAEGQELERKRETNAFRDAHPEAVVWCNGSGYRVNALNFTTRSILCEPILDKSIRTQGIQRVTVQFKDEPTSAHLPPMDVILKNGRVLITTAVEEYRRYRRTRVMRCRNRRCRYESSTLELRKCPVCGGPMQVKDVEHIEETVQIRAEKPLETQLDTRATWLELPEALHERFDAEFWPRWEMTLSGQLVSVGPSFQDAMHSMLHAILKAFPDTIRCDDSEIEGLHQAGLLGNDEFLLLYDNFPGGLGLVEEFFADPVPLLQSALNVVERCTCTDDEGCPFCMNHFGCSAFNQGLSKLAAQYLLKSLLGVPADGVVEELQDLVKATVEPERIVTKKAEHEV